MALEHNNGNPFDDRISFSARQQFSGLSMTKKEIETLLGGATAYTSKNVETPSQQPMYEFTFDDTITFYKYVEHAPTRPRALEVFCGVQHVDFVKKEVIIETLVRHVGAAVPMALGTVPQSVVTSTQQKQTVDMTLFGASSSLEPLDRQRKTRGQHAMNRSTKERHVINAQFEAHTNQQAAALVDTPPVWTSGFLGDEPRTKSELQEAVLFPVADDGNNVSTVALKANSGTGTTQNNLKKVGDIIANRGKEGLQVPTVVSSVPEDLFSYDEAGRDSFFESRKMTVWSDTQTWTVARQNGESTHLVTSDPQNMFARKLCSEVDSNASQSRARMTALLVEAVTPVSCDSDENGVSILTRGFDDSNAPGGDGCVAASLEKVMLADLAEHMVVFDNDSEETRAAGISSAPVMHHVMHEAGVHLEPCADFSDASTDNSLEVAAPRVDPSIGPEMIGTINSGDFIMTATRHMGGVSTEDFSVSAFDKSATGLASMIRSSLTDKERVVWDDGMALVRRNAACGSTQDERTTYRKFMRALVMNAPNNARYTGVSVAGGKFEIPDVNIGQAGFVDMDSVVFPACCTVEALDSIGALLNQANPGNWAGNAVRGACTIAKKFADLIRRKARDFSCLGGSLNLIASGAAAPAGIAVETVWDPIRGIKSNTPGEALLGALFPDLATVWVTRENGDYYDWTNYRDGKASLMTAFGFGYEATVDSTQVDVLFANVEVTTFREAAEAALAIRYLQAGLASGNSDAEKSTDALLMASSTIDAWMDAREACLRVARTPLGSLPDSERDNCVRLMTESMPRNRVDDMMYPVFCRAHAMQRSVAEFADTTGLVHTNLRVDFDVFRNQSADPTNGDRYIIRPGVPGLPSRMAMSGVSDDFEEELVGMANRSGAYMEALAKRNPALPGEITGARLTCASDSLFKRFSLLKRVSEGRDLTSTILLSCVPFSANGTKSLLEKGIIPPILPLAIKLVQICGLPVVTGIPNCMTQFKGIPGSKPKMPQGALDNRNNREVAKATAVLAPYASPPYTTVFRYASTPGEDPAKDVEGIIGITYTNAAGVTTVASVSSSAVITERADCIAVLPLGEVTDVPESSWRIGTTMDKSSIDANLRRNAVNTVVFHIGASCVDEALKPFSLGPSYNGSKQPFSGHYLSTLHALDPSLVKDGMGPLGHCGNAVQLASGATALQHTVRSLFGPDDLTLPSTVFAAPIFYKGSGYRDVGGYGEAHNVKSIIGHIKPKKNSIPKKVSLKIVRS